MNYFLELLQVALRHRDALSGIPTEEEWELVYQLAEEQAVTGIMLSALERLAESQKPDQMILLQWIGTGQMIEQQNLVMNKAVVRLCRMMTEQGIRIFVFKGQSVATYYPEPHLRQSGDIDFYCHHEDWEKAVRLFCDEKGMELNDLHTRKDVSFTWEDVVYEMHNRITLFNYPCYRRYWEKVVMPEILAHPYTVKIDGYEVPTLAPTYNALYIFVHIFQHLIASGIGLRQFVDWYYVLNANSNLNANVIDVEVLERHLKGLGLRKAYSGLGAILTDYLGMKEDVFPFEISDDDHKRAEKLKTNILEMGNFGHNVQYKSKNMWAHGLEHIWRMTKQAWVFHHYAPMEAWWHIPSMFLWWMKKIGRLIKRHLPFCRNNNI